jgi:hypothetical protein
MKIKNKQAIAEVVRPDDRTHTQRSYVEVTRTNLFFPTLPAFLPHAGSVPAVLNTVAPPQWLVALIPVAFSSSSPFGTGFPFSSSMRSSNPMHSSMSTNPFAPVPLPPAIIAALSQHNRHNDQTAVPLNSSLVRPRPSPASLATPVPIATNFSLASPVNKSENKKNTGVVAFFVSRDAGWKRSFITLFFFAVFAVVGVQSDWSTAQLSVARYLLTATSVGNVSLFAGGYAFGEL